MKPHRFSIPYSVVEKLPPDERFVYYELNRLAASEDTVDEDFKINLPKGCLITSNLRLAKITDQAYSKVAIAMERLEEKGLIEIRSINSREFQSFFMVCVKEMIADDEPAGQSFAF
jgi:hypothetical protein